MRVFLASAIDGLVEAEVEAEWLEAEALVGAAGHRLINNWGFYAGEAALGGDAAAIVRRDLELLGSAEALIVNFSRPSHQYVGCIFEIAHAHSLGIPVLAVDPRSVFRRRLWMRAYVDHFAESLCDALKCLASSRLWKSAR